MGTKNELRSCIICGEPVPKGYRKLCGKESCRKEYRKIYFDKFRKKNREKYLEWNRISAQRTRMSRFINNGKVVEKMCKTDGCNTILPTLSRKRYCDRCSVERNRQKVREYFRKNKEREALRKKMWYEKKKRNE